MSNTENKNLNKNRNANYKPNNNLGKVRQQNKSSLKRLKITTLKIRLRKTKKTLLSQYLKEI